MASAADSADSRLTPEKKAELIAQVKQLSADTLSIDDSFENISRLLGDLSEAHIPDQFVKDIERLSTTWHSLHKTYSDLLWRSRDVAGEARVAAEDFANIFITEVLMNEKFNMAEVQDAIRAYKESTEQDKKKAMDMVDGFKALAHKVERFCKEWEETIQRNHLHRFSFRYRRYEEDITALTSSVRALKVKIVAMSLAVAVTIVATGVLALAFAMNGETEALGVAGLISIPVDFSFKAIKRRVAERAAQVERLEKLKAEREESCSGLKDIMNIATKLRGIANFWGCITADLMALDNLIRNTLRTDTQECWRDVFNKRLKLTRDSYADLSDIFREYQIAVNPESLRMQK